jgi:uncharacterized protein with NRDE domain
MCSIFFAYKTHPCYRLVVAANRDEFYERPTEQASFWDDAKNVLAGRDLKHGGTWLGVTKEGKFAAVTNYRDPFTPPGDLSRGNLVSSFLLKNSEPEKYIEEIEESASRYGGFNLVASDEESLWYFSNRELKRKRLSEGVYGLSNHLLDTPWQKVVKGKNALTDIVSEEEISVEDIFYFLSDQQKADDSFLPDTGIGIEKERILSSVFIVSPIYGTRSSTVVLIDNDGGVKFVERTFRNGVYHGEEVNFRFKTPKTVSSRQSAVKNNWQ